MATKDVKKEPVNDGSIDARSRAQDPELYDANVRQYPEVAHYAAGAAGDEHSPVGSKDSHGFGVTIPVKEKAKLASEGLKSEQDVNKSKEGIKTKEEVKVTDEGAKQPKRN